MRVANSVANSLLSLFCPFVETKNKNQVVSFGGLVTKNIRKSSENL